MQLIDGAQFSNITFSLALFVAASAAEMFATVIIPVTSIYPTL